MAITMLVAGGLGLITFPWWFPRLKNGIDHLLDRLEKYQVEPEGESNPRE